MSSHDFDRGAFHGMHRNRPERRLAGVCAALADELAVPLPVVRAGFLVALVLPGARPLALLVYLGLWFATPPALGARSALDRSIAAFRDLFGVEEPRPRRREPLNSDELPSDPSA